jgi:hypothetical protein
VSDLTLFRSLTLQASKFALMGFYESLRMELNAKQRSIPPRAELGAGGSGAGAGQGASITMVSSEE